jgi:hypothetical protein
MQPFRRDRQFISPLAFAISLTLSGACTVQLDLGTQDFRTPDAAASPMGGNIESDGSSQTGGREGPRSGPGGFGGMGGMANIGGTMGCAVFGSRDLSLEPVRPLAFVALQRSVSMFMKSGDRSKLEQAGLALEKVFSGRRLPAGLVQFPDLSPFCNADSACCASAIILTPKSDAGRALHRTISCEGQPAFCFQTGKSIPTGAALHEIRNFNKVSGLPGRKSVLLITDGDPTCDGTNACDAAVVETSALLQEGVDTYVIALESESTSTSCLTRIARAGDTIEAPAVLSVVGTSAELEASLLEAVNRIEKGFCELRLRFAPKRQEDVHVFVDGVDIPRATLKPGGSSFSFSKDSNSRIEILGEACDSLKRQPVDVRAIESCCPNERDCRM